MRNILAGILLALAMTPTASGDDTWRRDFLTLTTRPATAGTWSAAKGGGVRIKGDSLRFTGDKQSSAWLDSTQRGHLLAQFTLQAKAQARSRFHCVLFADPKAMGGKVTKTPRGYLLTLADKDGVRTLTFARLPDARPVATCTLPATDTARMAIATVKGDWYVFVDDAPAILWQDIYFKLGRAPEYETGHVGLGASGGTVTVSDFSLAPIRERQYAQLPKLRPMNLQTDLAQAAIVIGDNPLHKTLANRIAEALKAGTGHAPEILNDTDVEPTLPGARPLIVLGNLVENRVVRKLYLEWHCMVDRRFPGPGGHILQTIHAPWGARENRPNVVLLGASDDAGLRAATDHFLKILPKDGRLERTHLVSLGAEFERQLEGYLKSDEFHLILPIGYPNYFQLRGVPKSQRYGLLYLVTGKDAYAEQYKKTLFELVRKGKLTHLYLTAWPLMWDLMEEHPVFTDAERLEVANWLLKTLRSGEGIRFSRLQLIHQKRAHQNHDTRCALGCFYIARYLRNHYGLAEMETYLRRIAWYFDSQADWSKPMCDTSMHQWGATLENKACYAIVSGNMRFFESGAARQAAERALATTNNVGLMAVFGDCSYGNGADSLLAKAAYVYGDGRYLWPLQRRGDVRSNTDEVGRGFATDLPPKPPTDLVGVTRVPYDRRWWDGIKALDASKLPARPNIPYKKAFDKIAFRGGLDRNDEFLLLDGMHGASHDYDDVNTIHEYSRNGRVYIGTFDGLFSPTIAQHNGVNIVRDGLSSVLPVCAEHLHSGMKDGLLFSQTRVNDFADADWTRTVFMRPDAYFVVIDRVTARAAGTFTLTGRWRTLGEPTLEKETLTVTQWPREDKPKPDTQTFFHIQTPADLVQNARLDSRYGGKPVRDYPYAQPRVNMLAASKTVQLKQGESAFLYTLAHETGGESAPRFVLRAIAPGVVRVAGPDTDAVLGAPAVPFKTSVMEMDADLFYLDKNGDIAEGRRTSKGIAHAPTADAKPQPVPLDALDLPEAEPRGKRAAATGALPTLRQLWRAEMGGEIRTLRVVEDAPGLGVLAVPSKKGEGGLPGRRRPGGPQNQRGRAGERCGRGRRGARRPAGNPHRPRRLQDCLPQPRRDRALRLRPQTGTHHQQLALARHERSPIRMDRRP